MKKTALAIAIPVAIVGAAVAGAWYTGSRVEQEVNRGITEAILQGDADKAEKRMRRHLQKSGERTLPRMRAPGLD